MLASIDSWNMQPPYLLMNKLCYRNNALLILWSGQNWMTRIKTKFNKAFIASLWLTYPFFWYMTPRQWVICFRRSGTIIFSQNFANRRILSPLMVTMIQKKKNKHIAETPQFLFIDRLFRKRFFVVQTRGWKVVAVRIQVLPSAGCLYSWCGVEADTSAVFSRLSLQLLGRSIHKYCL